MAADKDLRTELLSVGPFCMTEGDFELDDSGEPVLNDQGKPSRVFVVAYCTPNATRTQRSGVTDVEYMIRPDRSYWSV